MCRKSVLLLGLGMAVVAVAQEQPSTWNPADEPFPTFDQRKRNRHESFAATLGRLLKPRTGPCSIPLLQVQPMAHAAIAQMRPKEGQGTIRMAEPPAPPCEKWGFQENELILVRPRDKRE